MEAAFTYVVFHLSVVFVHELKQPHFDLGLIQKRFLVLYDLNGNPFLFHSIIGFYNLQKRKVILSVISNNVTVYMCFAILCIYLTLL